MPLADETISAGHGKETDAGIADGYAITCTTMRYWLQRVCQLNWTDLLHVGRGLNMPLEATQKSLSSKQKSTGLWTS